MLPCLRHPEDFDLARWRENTTFKARCKVNLEELRSLLALGNFDYAAALWGADTLLELYRWALWSAHDIGPREPGRWGETSAFGILAGSSAVDVREPPVFTSTTGRAPFVGRRPWQEQLAKLLAIMLNAGGLVAEWRQRAGLMPLGNRIVTGPIATWGLVETELKLLFWCAHPLRRLTVAMNECHPHAREPMEVRLRPTREGWCAALYYGFDGSGWVDPICTQKPKEAFVLFIRRATALFESILAPCAAPAASTVSQCSAKYGIRISGASCGDPLASPIEEAFVFERAGKPVVVTAPTARAAWKAIRGPKPAVMRGRGGTAWAVSTDGRLRRAYNQDDGELAFSMFQAAGGSQ